MNIFSCHSRAGGNLSLGWLRIPACAGMTILLLLSNANAEPSTPKASFEAINNCVKHSDTNGCKDYFTASSIDLYTRFMSYGLMACLPKDAQYYSEEKLDNSVLLRASVTDYGKQRYMRLLFVQEEGEWKLDVPESLHTAMGKNWEKQIQMSEQILLLMKQQLGTDLDCNMIKNLVKPKK